MRLTAGWNILAPMKSPAISILLVGSALCVWAQLPQPPPPLAQADVEQLEITVQQNPTDFMSQKLLGKNYAYFMLGITALDRYGDPSMIDEAKFLSDFAQHAAAQMGSDSTPATVLAEGGLELWNDSFSVSADATIHNVPGPPDPRTVAVKAIDLAILAQPDNSNWRSYRIRILIFRSNFNNVVPLSAADAYAQVKQDFAVLDDNNHRWLLSSIAKLAVRAGALDDATGFAQEMLSKLGDRFFGLWLDGEYVFFANMVLGQVAIRNGDTDGAKSYLLTSGTTTGAPSLNSFGPNMSLAKDLLEAGERDSVLTFFDECRVFWKLDNGALDKWSNQVHNGQTPNFGANLLY